jgi:asparagine synthase (glutamine-hydrolysing)
MASLRERRLIRPDYVDTLVRRHREEHAAYYGEFLWVLMMLELWLDQRPAARLEKEAPRALR